jgi:methylmalonyl-CoA mutase C-terminal domain/subunit
LVTETVEALNAQNVDDALLVVGGIIPKVDIPLLKKEGVHEVFGPGTPMETIVDYIKANAPRGSGAGGPAE